MGGTGTATPSGVAIPGAYDATDPGILINIYQQLDTYNSTLLTGLLLLGCHTNLILHQFLDQPHTLVHLPRLRLWHTPPRLPGTLLFSHQLSRLRLLLLERLGLAGHK